MQLSKVKHMYFLGIGGIGMSALARYFHRQGVHICGYDLTPSVLTDQLCEEGMRIHFEEDIAQIPGQTELVIYTPAIPATHAELVYLRNQNIPILKRAEVIGKLSQEHFTISIGGTHGKTSITALTGHLLKTAGIQVTAFVGGICNNYQSNLILSEQTDILLVEADEYDRSFLQIASDVVVISSMDADHLDIYTDLNDVYDGFMAFAQNRSSDGMLIYNHKLAGLTDPDGASLSYGLSDQALVRAENIRITDGAFVFDFIADDLKISDIRLKLPGLHYIENTLASAAVALHMGLSADQIRKGIASFTGIKRRFEFLIQTSDLVFVDDYAHHPEEIKATVKAIKMLYPGKKITGIFQPHLYSRTRDFAEAFARSLEPLDEIMLLDIYPAREQPIAGVTSALIGDQIAHTNTYLVSKAELIEKLQLHKPEVLLSMGAGDIGLLVDKIKSALFT